VLKERLTTDSRILVVDGYRSLAACGIGVVTDTAYRRRGHSRAIMRGLLDWFRERQVARVDLYASHDGEPLYRRLGFVDHPDPSLYWRP
jgi:GNAT superfamily N-acetyltransferase